MEIVLDSGLASQYLITDPTRAVCVMNSRHRTGIDLLFCNGKLSLELLSEFFGRSRPAKTGFFKKLFADTNTYSVSDAIHCLNEIHNDKRPSRPIDFNRPLFVFSKEFDSSVLRVIKIAKIRGFGEFGAVSTEQVADLLVPEFQKLAGHVADFALEDPYCRGFSACSNVMIIAGLHKTVLVPAQNPEMVLSRYPELVGSVDVNSQEPI